MYFLSLMKCPSFNPDSALRMKLICCIHKEAQKEKLCANVCPCIYGLEEKILTQLIKNEIWREDVIEIEKRKWLEKISGVDIFKLKYERTKEWWTISSYNLIVIYFSKILDYHGELK